MAFLAASQIWPHLKADVLILVAMSLSTLLCGLYCLSTVITAVKQDCDHSSQTRSQRRRRCFYYGQMAMHFSWYRQTLGNRPELLSNIYKYSEPSKVFYDLENHPRLSVQRDEGTNNLLIFDVQPSDSAMYYCGSSQSHMLEFGDGIFLNVKGDSAHEHNIVVQNPVSESVQPGGSVTLSCIVYNCDGEHSVYWFMQGFQQGLLLTHSGHCPHGSVHVSPTQSCMYHLHKTNLSSYDAGTYYCAVASCGRVLFGSGSRVLVMDDAEQQLSQMRILVWLSIFRTGLLLLFLAVFRLVCVMKQQ